METASRQPAVIRGLIFPAALLLLLSSPLAGQAIYVPNFITSSVSGYLVNPASGVVSTIPGFPIRTGTSPIQALIHPSGKFLYVLNAGSGDITLFGISAPSGLLTLSPCPHCDAPTPSGMAVDPLGNFLFVTNLALGGLTSYSIDPANGQLVKGPSFGVGGNSRLGPPAIDPSGRYLYVADSNSGQVFGLSINGGSLTSIPGSPFQAGAGTVGLAASRTAVFAANQSSGDVTMYQLGAAGTLAQVGLPVPTGGNPTSVAVDPTGNYVYAANQSQLLALNTTPSGLYPLTYLRGYNAGTVPSFVAVDPDGNFVYVVNTISNDVSGFAISAGGTLLPTGSASTTNASGSRLLTVRHIGDATTIAQSPTTLTTTSYGTPVSVQGAVRNRSNPANTPTGTVSLSIGDSPVANPTVPLDAAGGFSYVFDSSTQFLPAGSNLVEVTYNPGAGFENTAPLRVLYNVTKAVPALILSPPSNPVSGQSTTLTVSARQTAGRYPSGSAVFSVDGVAAGAPAPLINGAASMAYVPSAGNHTITLLYSGDDFFSPASAAPVAFFVKQLTSTVVSSSSTSLRFGQTLTLTAAVTAGGNTVGGTVDFFDNGAQMNSAPVPISANQAVCGPRSLPTGTHVITAAFSGDANNAASTNAAVPLAVMVTRATLQIAQPQLQSAPTYGPLTFSAAVTAPAENPPPSGSIALNEGGSALGSATLSNGTATFSAILLGAGNHQIIAAYSGDSNYMPATSASLVLDINRAPSLVSAPEYTGGAGSLAFSVIVGAANPASGIPGGTVALNDGNTAIASATLVKGVAAFNLPSLAGGNHILTAVYSGDANFEPATSATLSFTANRIAAQVAAPQLSGAAVYGSTTFSVSVSGASSSGPPPGGTVSLNEGAASIATAALSNGSAVFAVATLGAGNHSLSAVYSGDSNYLPATSAASSVTIAKATPRLSLTAPAYSQLVSGQGVSLTAVLSGVPLPSGTVDFYDSGVRLNSSSVSLAGGQASFTGPLNGAGPHQVFAIFGGDTNCNPASTTASPLEFNVGQAQAVMGTLALSGPATFGQPLKVAATLSAVAPGSGAPSGVVFFKDQSNLIGSAPLTGGLATLTTAALSPGGHAISAVFGGTADFSASTSPTLYFTVEKAPSTLALTISGMPPSILLKASVGGLTDPLPSGSVQFWTGGTLLGSAPLAQSAGSDGASITVPSISGAVTAVYSGDTNFQPSTSTASAIGALTQVSTAMALKVNPNPALLGQPVTCTASLSWKGSASPGGRFQLYDGAISLGSAPAAAQVVFTTTLGAGSHSLTATYTGDSTYLPSLASSNLMVNRLGPAIALGPPAVAVYGQAVTLTATVSPAAGGSLLLPAGSFSFMEGNAALATVPLANGVASAVLPRLEPGAHQITGIYGGDSNWGPANSSVTLTVTKAATALDIAAANGEEGGLSLTATLSVVAPGAGIPSGTVDFIEPVSQQVLATVPLAGLTASASLPAGAAAKAVIAVYSGDAHFAPGNSASATQFSILNAASFAATGLAPNQIVTVFGKGWTTGTFSASSLPLPAALGGVSVSLTDSSGAVHQAQLFYASPSQISFLAPSDIPQGPAILRIAPSEGAAVSAVIPIGAVAPGLFAANTNGEGVAAAQIVRVHPDGSQDAPQATAAYDPASHTWIPAPIDAPSGGDEIYLVLYGTGIRNHSASVTLRIDGQEIPVLYAGPQSEYPGLDQVNALLPPDLKSGPAEISVAVDGVASNTLTLVFR